MISTLLRNVTQSLAQMIQDHTKTPAGRQSVATGTTASMTPQQEGSQGEILSAAHDGKTDTTKQFKAQLPRNVLLQAVAFGTHIAVGILLTPYLVRHLGRAAYGLVPLASVMTEYVNLISQSISSAVGRFLTIALHRDDQQDANRVFNTAFFSYLALTLLQIPVFGLIICYAHRIFTIPDALYRDAIVLFVCSATSFLINLVCSVYSVPIYANNRVDILRTFELSRHISRIVGIVGLFMIFGPALRFVGYVDLVVTIGNSVARVLIGRHFAPTLKLDLRAYDWHKVRQLVGMGSWMVVNYLGFLLFLRIDVWVCNRFISPESAGDYAAILQWSNLIRQAGTTMSAVIGPMIVIYYARSQVNELIRLSKLSVRMFCLFLAIPIGVLCAFSPSILTIWLGESFARLAPLMVLMLSHLVINIGVMPLFGIQTALNKVKWPGLVTMAMGALNLVLAVFFTAYLNWGVYGVAIAGAIGLTAKNALFVPIYGAWIMHQPWHTFVKSYISGLAFLAGFIGFGYIYGKWMPPASWAHLLVIATIAGVIGLAVVWFISPKKDRQLMISLVPGRFRSLAMRFLPV
jgi:O-antigen/teichoic acid export membrane protein